MASANSETVPVRVKAGNLQAYAREEPCRIRTNWFHLFPSTLPRRDAEVVPFDFATAMRESRRMQSRRCAALGLLVVAIGCSRFNVHVNRDPSVDLTQFRSWAWLPPELLEPADQRLLDRYLDRTLRATAERVLREKGYVPAAGQPPDFFLNYRLTTSDHSSPQPPYRYGLGEWWTDAAARARDSYDTGTLLVDAVLPRTHSLVWRGTASARLLPHASLEKSAHRTELVVEHILADFPARGH
jgi:hypothetical protein